VSIQLFELLSRIPKQLEVFRKAPAHCSCNPMIALHSVALVFFPSVQMPNVFGGRQPKELRQPYGIGRNAVLISQLEAPLCSQT